MCLNDSSRKTIEGNPKSNSLEIKVIIANNALNLPNDSTPKYLAAKEIEMRFNAKFTD